jgi:hypothetical protein
MVHSSAGKQKLHLREPRVGNPEKIKSKQKNQDLAVGRLASKASRVFACAETLG